MSIADKIIEELIEDLCDRQLGFDSDWHNMDEDIQKEIIEDWKRIINKYVKE